MIDIKDWRVVLGWDAGRVKSGLKSLDTMMKRVEKSGSRLTDKKQKDQDRAWAQHKKQEAAKQRMTEAAYRQRERQEAAASRRRETEANKAKRRQKSEVEFVNKRNRLMSNLRDLNSRVDMNQRRGVFSKQEAAIHKGKIGAGLAAVGAARDPISLARAQGAYARIVAETRNATRAANEHFRAIQRANFAANSLSGSIKNMAKSWLSIYAVFEVVSEFYRVGTAFDSMRASSLAAAGDVKTAGENMEFLIATSQKLGTNLQTSVIGFNKLGIAARAAGFEQQQVRDMFSAVSESVTAFTLSDEQQKNIFYALSQMASKARISTEELQRQMGDYLPTAMKAMTLAYSDFSGKNVDTGQLLKLIQDGKVMSKDVLPAFAKHLSILAREGGALAAAMEKVATQQKRFVTQVQLNTDESFSDSQGAFARGWKDLTVAMVQARPVFMVFGKIVGGAFAGLGLVMRVIAPILGMVATGFENLFKVFSDTGRSATEALRKSGEQLSLWERFALIASSAAYALAAAVFYVIGGLEWLNEVLQVGQEDSALTKTAKSLSSFGAAALGFVLAWKAGIGWLVKGLSKVVGLAWAASKALGLARGAAPTVGAAVTSTAKGFGGKLLSKVAAPLAVGGEIYNRFSNLDEGSTATLIKRIMTGDESYSQLKGLDGKPWQPAPGQLMSEGKSSPTTVHIEMNNEFSGASTADGKSFAESFSSTLDSILTTGNY